MIFKKCEAFSEFASIWSQKVHYDAGTRPGISKQSYSTCGSCHRPYDPVALQAGARQWTALPVRPILAVRQEKPKPTRTRWLRPREPAVRLSVFYQT